MANTSAFYQACAEQSLRDAEAGLSNVREQHLHSARAWQALADRIAKIEASRRNSQISAKAGIQPDRDDASV
jgi:hypothetical protein